MTIEIDDDYAELRAVIQKQVGVSQMCLLKSDQFDKFRQDILR